MKIIPTEIPDVSLLEPQVFYDARGFFMETYHARKLAELGITAQFVQDNHSRSQRGTLRGLHYQIRQAQGKLVRVVNGEIFDVAVDLRRRSPTFGRWTGAILSADNKRQLWIPPGFAHGFYALSETVGSDLQSHRLLRAGMGAHPDLERSADQHRVAARRRSAAGAVGQRRAGPAVLASRSV